VALQEFATWLQATPFSIAIQSIEWIVPTLQSIHILMIGVVFVSVLVVALRVLGLVRAEEPLLQTWRRFAPFLWSGVVVMVTTGVLLTISEPLREFMATSFRLKMLLLLVGVVSAALFGRQVRAAAGANVVRLSTGIRVAAVGTVLLWLAVIFLGRAIAYDDAIWGARPSAVLQGADPQ
jgi:uncharacterized membrane protein SirB2